MAPCTALQAVARPVNLSAALGSPRSAPATCLGTTLAGGLTTSKALGRSREGGPHWAARPRRPVVSVRAVASAAQADAVVAQPAERPLWLPGITPPAHLDGSLAGDYGFDPLGLGADAQDLRWYVQAELLHARFAMAAVSGILFTDLLRVTGVKDLPAWYDAGAARYDIAPTGTLFVIQLILFGFVEMKRYMDFRTPKSQGDWEVAWFFGIEDLLEGLQNGYPGGPLFNPLGLAAGPARDDPLKWKEIKNGRLAMVAFVGFCVQAAVTGVGPIDNLLAHVADPFHVTIVQTLGRAL